VLTFPKSLDRVSLERRLTVRDAGGKEIAGRIEIGAAERSWAFHPKKAWRVAGYRLDVAAELEDVAGNTPQLPFDRDLNAPTPPPQALTLRFRPQAAQGASGKDAR
jgi:hypothetical protein